MKYIIRLRLTIFVSISFLTFDSYAQRGMGWRGSGGWGPGSQYCGMYDLKTVETISGEVVSVEKFIPRKGMFYGFHLMVKTDKETISVHLGPGWYIENRDITIEPNDKVEIKGSRITFNGKPAIIAAEVKKGNEILALRDERGMRWTGICGRGPCSEYWRPCSQYWRMYAATAIETLSGEVINVEKKTPTKGMSYGVHLMVKTDEETIPVHLGPGWYIEKQGIAIEPDDRVEIKGSRIIFDGKPAIIAVEVKKGDEILRLRDENGFPYWSGWRLR